MRTHTGRAITATGLGRPNCPRRIKEIYDGLGGLGFPCSNMKHPLSAALKFASSYGHFTALDSCSLCLCWKGIRSFQKYFHPYEEPLLFYKVVYSKRTGAWGSIRVAVALALSQVHVGHPTWCDFICNKWRTKTEISLVHSSFIEEYRLLNWSVFLFCGETSCWIPSTPCKRERKTEWGVGGFMKVDNRMLNDRDREMWAKFE